MIKDVAKENPGSCIANEFLYTLVSFNLCFSVFLYISWRVQITYFVEYLSIEFAASTWFSMALNVVDYSFPLASSGPWVSVIPPSCNFSLTTLKGPYKSPSYALPSFPCESVSGFYLESSALLPSLQTPKLLSLVSSWHSTEHILQPPLIQLSPIFRSTSPTSVSPVSMTWPI